MYCFLSHAGYNEVPLIIHEHDILKHSLNLHASLDIAAAFSSSVGSLAPNDIEDINDILSENIDIDTREH